MKCLPTVICHYGRFMTAGLHHWGRSEGAHPFCGPLSWRGVNVKLSSHTNQFGWMAGSDLQPAFFYCLRVCRQSWYQSYCYCMALNGLLCVDVPLRTYTHILLCRTRCFPCHTITVTHVMGGFMAIDPQKKVEGTLHSLFSP